jgi:hypothetical protein
MTNMNLQEHIRKILREETSVNSKEDKLKYLVFKLINRNVEGAHLYENKGSIWLIFTDDEKWVIKLTKEGTLLYNYNFFESIFKYLSLDVVENQHYITEWVEDTIQNGVRRTIKAQESINHAVEDTIQNGVRHTQRVPFANYGLVEDTIQNGVRSTAVNGRKTSASVEDTIQNGMKIGNIKND